MAKGILLVEDSNDDVELVRRAFQQCKIANPIFVVSSAEEALAHLHRCKTPKPGTSSDTTLVLLDLGLPGTDGIEVLKVLASTNQLRQCPVVVLSAASELKKVNECYKLGATSFLLKPITTADVMNLAQNIPKLRLELASTAESRPSAV